MARKVKEQNLNNEFFEALDELETTRGIKKEFFIESLESGLAAAYKKNSGGDARLVSVKIDPITKQIIYRAYKTVASEVVNPDTELTLEEAQQIKPDAQVGDEIGEEFIPQNFGRIAAGTAKQVIVQKLREFERGLAFGELQDKVETLINATIRRVDNGVVYLELAGTTIEGVMSAVDQIPTEKYNIGDKIKVYIKKLKDGFHGVQAIVSRSCPQFVEKLFELEVPEITSGVVEIKNIVREAGYRTKLSIESHDPQVDALGACVGNRGARVNAVVNSLSGEKVDIIIYSDDPFEYIARALSPAKVISVEIDEILKASKVVVPDDKLSLAIGKSGQNVRLAAKLTGWKIDVKSESAAGELEAQNKEASEVSTDVSDANSLFVDLDE